MSCLSRLSSCATPAVVATLVLLLLLSSRPYAAPIPPPKRPSVEVVFCLDTTGSMSGLIEGAKLKIWGICNQILNGRPMPNLKVGLVIFRDKQDDYVSKVYDLRDDLDEIYADMQTFAANGGGDTEEAVNQALDDAVTKIKWSTDPKTVRIVFLVGDAAPHMDYPDDVKYPITCAKAAERGIIINTIQCGNDASCTKFWKDICEKANGAFVTIPQAGGIRGVNTPFDRRLSEINTELSRGTLLYGDSRKRDADAKKVQTALTMPLEVAADRAGYMTKEGKVARYDLLDSIRLGKVKLESLRPEEMPGALQKLTSPQRQEYLDKVGHHRAKLLREAGELDRRRLAHVSKELEKNKDSFDRQVLELLRKQAARRVRY